MSVRFSSSDYIAVANDASLTFENTDPFSISGWVYFNGSVNSLIIHKFGTASGQQRGWRLLTDNGGIRFILQSQSSNLIDVTSGYGTITNIWAHITVTYDGSIGAPGVNFYINSVHSQNDEVTSDSLSLTTVSTDPIVISQNTSYLNTQHRLAVYDKELSQAEVDEIYNDGYSINFDTLSTSGNIISYWEMGDGTGDAFPTITDQVGSNNGTMTNMTVDDIVDDQPQWFYLFNEGSGIENIDGYYIEIDDQTDVVDGYATVSEHGSGSFDTQYITINDSGEIFVEEIDSVDGYGGGGVNVITYYTMRGVGDPGPGYVYWTVIDAPDFSGSQAPSSIVTDSAVIFQSWVDD